jgi:CRP/FNR family cyclic AMP-dependent transcriptional regulator
MSLVESSALLRHVRGWPTVSFRPGDVLVQSGARSGKLLVLKEGRVEVSSQGVALGTIDTPGAILGEMAALLERPHTADVRAAAATVCYVADAATVLREDSVVALHVAVVLAQRVDLHTEALVALKRKGGGAGAGKAIDQSIEQLAKAVVLGGFV